MTTATTSFEQPRMEIGHGARPLHRALAALGKQVDLDLRLRELVNLRASILNGCAYCTTGTRRSRARPARASTASTLWPPGHEAPFFDAKERAALALTDSVTMIAEQHVPRDVWEEASVHFESDELAQLVWAITVINAWNRIAITTRMLPAA
jgi:alkylhydroperoxidase family enzyme